MQSKKILCLANIIATRLCKFLKFFMDMNRFSHRIKQHNSQMGTTISLTNVNSAMSELMNRLLNDVNLH